MQIFTAIFYLVMVQNVSVISNHAIKLFQYSSIVFDLHNKELCDGSPRLNVTQDTTVGLHFHALWSEV